MHLTINGVEVNADTLGQVLSTQRASTDNKDRIFTFTDGASKVVEIVVKDISRDLNLNDFSVGTASFNYAPTDISLSPPDIDENKAAGSTVGSFTTTDPNSGNTFTYSLVSGTGSEDNGAFSIVNNQLIINGSADFETKNTYYIRVKTTDR